MRTDFARILLGSLHPAECLPAVARDLARCKGTRSISWREYANSKYTTIILTRTEAVKASGAWIRQLCTGLFHYRAADADTPCLIAIETAHSIAIVDHRVRLTLGVLSLECVLP